jgi:hypothetical protein
VKNQRAIFCPIDQTRIANVPMPLLWTGAVSRIPSDPEDLAGLMYLHCETCRRAKRAQWHRFEAMPPNPTVVIRVRPDSLMNSLTDHCAHKTPDVVY